MVKRQFYLFILLAFSGLSLQAMEQSELSARLREMQSPIGNASEHQSLLGNRGSHDYESFAPSSLTSALINSSSSEYLQLDDNAEVNVASQDSQEENGLNNTSAWRYLFCCAKARFTKAQKNNAIVNSDSAESSESDNSSERLIATDIEAQETLNIIKISFGDQEPLLIENANNKIIIIDTKANTLKFKEIDDKDDDISSCCAGPEIFVGNILEKIGTKFPCLAKVGNSYIFRKTTEATINLALAMGLQSWWNDPGATLFARENVSNSIQRGLKNIPLWIKLPVVWGVGIGFNVLDLRIMEPSIGTITGLGAVSMIFIIRAYANSLKIFAEKKRLPKREPIKEV